MSSTRGADGAGRPQHGAQRDERANVYAGAPQADGVDAKEFDPDQGHSAEHSEWGASDPYRVERAPLPERREAHRGHAGEEHQPEHGHRDRAHVLVVTFWQLIVADSGQASVTPEEKCSAVS